MTPGVDTVIVVVVHPDVLYTPLRPAFPSTPEIVIRLGQAGIPVVVMVVVPPETVIPVKLPKRVFQAGIVRE